MLKTTKHLLLTLALILVLPIISGNATNNETEELFQPVKMKTAMVLDDEVDCLARNIYFEARSLSTGGKMAVAQVTLNRVKSERFPSSICDVVYEGRHYYNSKLRDFVPIRNRCQFSWYCDGKSDAIHNEKKFNKIVEFSKYFVNDYYHKDHVDITDGALFYHASWMEKYPKWSKTKRKLAQFDSHIFYR